MKICQPCDLADNMKKGGDRVIGRVIFSDHNAVKYALLIFQQVDHVMKAHAQADKPSFSFH